MVRLGLAECSSLTKSKILFSSISTSISPPDLVASLLAPMDLVNMNRIVFSIVFSVSVSMNLE